MGFSDYYTINEVSVKSNRDVRFLASSNNRSEWPEKVKDVINATDVSGVKKDIVFIISDRSSQFVMNLISNGNNLSYSVRELSFNWLESNGLTTDDQGKFGFYFDMEAKEFVYQENGRQQILERDFSYGDVDYFFDKLTYINKLCESRREFTLFSKLYYIDKFSPEEVSKLKSNISTPRWFLSSLKDDDYRKSSKGFFGNLFNYN